MVWNQRQPARFPEAIAVVGSDQDVVDAVRLARSRGLRVALGGYLLAGGQGWNQGTWGPACQNVLALDLVNADGDVITADAQQNPDLLWVARGGGPGFPGVILRYHLRLFTAPRTLAHSMYVYPLDQVEAVVPWLAQTVPSLSPAVEQLLLMAPAPPPVAAQLADPQGRYLVLWSIAFGDSLAQTSTALAPLDASPVRDRALARLVSVPVTWDELFAVEGAAFPEGDRYDTEVIWSDADPLRVVGGLRDRVAQAPSPKTMILAAVTGPPTVDPAAREYAYSLAAPLYIAIYSIWENAADDAANMRWQRETIQSVAQVTRGYYMGETDLLASSTRAADSLAPGVWERVQAIRQRYDPQGVFWGHIGQQDA
jgi:FAD/FMN-containing dehydrogenase